MLRLASFVGVLTSAAALLASCAMDAGAAPEVSLCDRAAVRLAECTGVPPADTIVCDASDAPQAERLLAMTCEELDDPKADGGLRCSWLGRKLGMCVRVADDEELLSQLGETGPGAAALDGSFEVLVWNIHKGAEEPWDAEMRAIAKGFEIFMIQEFFLDTESRKTFGDLEDTEWLFASSFFDVDDVPTGVVTGAMVPSTDATPLRSPVVEPVLSTPKMVLVTTYDLAWHTDDLMVVNVHAINFRTAGSFEQHMAAVEAAIGAHPGPMVLAGDFNTWSGGRHETLERVAERLGLDRVTPEADERGFLELDHVFARGLTVHGARFVNGLESSDHAPIAVSFGPI